MRSLTASRQCCAETVSHRPALHCLFALVCCLFADIAASPAARASIVRVPSQYPNIQAGINAAANGDIVLVADGTYSGGGNFNLTVGFGQTITIKSENGAANCTIDCQSAGRGFHFENSSGNGCTVDGFTIRGGVANEGGGIYIFSANPTIANCIIENCATTGDYFDSSRSGQGGGLYTEISSSLISHCVFRYNTSILGGGMSADVESNVTISGCQFYNNNAFGGGGLALYGSNTVTSCLFANNIGDGSLYGGGGGIYTVGSGTSTITNCTFNGNVSIDSPGGAIQVSSQNYTALTNCILWHDLSGNFNNFTTNEIYVLPNSITPSPGSITINYSDVQGGFGGTNNLNSNPGFVNANNNDYRLLSTSPCINLGSSVGSLSSTDADYRPRVLGGVVDMGAYEYSAFKPVAGLAGSALQFTGSQSQAVAVPNFGAVAPTTEITVEFWQNAALLKQQSSIGVNVNTATNRINAHVPYADGVVYWDFGNISTNGRLTYTPPVSLLNSWQHFALVASNSGVNNPMPGHTGAYMAIYRNGAMEAYKDGASSFTQSAVPLYLGGDPSYPFNGALDEVRIWNRALGSTEIKDDLNVSLSGGEPGLAAYYRFDEGTNTLAHDATPHGNDGVFVGSPAWVASGANLSYVNVIPGVPRSLALPAFDSSAYPLAYTIVTNPSNGVLSGNTPAVTYTPGVNYTGYDVFSYRVNNDYLDSAAAKVQLGYGYILAPVLTSLNPSGILAGGGGFTLTVNGTGFYPGTSVQWNSKNLTTTYVSPTQLTAVVPATLTAAPGTANVTASLPYGDGGASNALAITIAAPPVATLAGSALQCDGATQYAAIPHQSNLNAYPLTVEVWVKTTKTTGSVGLVNKYLSNSRNGYTLNLYNGQPTAFYFADSANYVWDSGTYTFLGGSVADGKWHHIAFTVDASGGRLYVDSVLKNSLAWTGTPASCTTTQPVTLAKYDDYFAGQMDDVKMWGVALGAAQIATDSTASLTDQYNISRILAYYRFDEAGNSVNDAASGNTGTLIGNPVRVASTAPINTILTGYLGYAGLTLNGVPQAIFAAAGFDAAGLPLTYSIVVPPMHGTFIGTTYVSDGTSDTDTFYYKANNGLADSVPVRVNIAPGSPGTVQGMLMSDAVTNLNTTAVPMLPITAEFRTIGGTDVLFTRDATLSVGSFAFQTNYNIANVPPGRYNVAIKSDNTLRTIVPVFIGETTPASVRSLANVVSLISSQTTTVLQGGDATNNNIVDFDDFLVFLNAFGGKVNTPNTVYDPTADFNYDGIVDFDDFLVLLNNFGLKGVP